MNSIPDQYLARVGGTVHVWKGFSASLAWRMEGLKRYDLFGDSHPATPPARQPLRQNKNDDSHNSNGAPTTAPPALSASLLPPFCETR